MGSKRTKQRRNGRMTMTIGWCNFLLRILLPSVKMGFRKAQISGNILAQPPTRGGPWRIDLGGVNKATSSSTSSAWELKSSLWHRLNNNSIRINKVAVKKLLNIVLFVSTLASRNVKNLATQVDRQHIDSSASTHWQQHCTTFTLPSKSEKWTEKWFEYVPTCSNHLNPKLATWDYHQKPPT